MGAMRLLLTGFEPFGGESVNPSGEIVRVIEESPPAGVELTTMILPVRGRVSFSELIPSFEAGSFDAWLGTGEAGGRAPLSVERVGINLLVDRGPESAFDGEQALVEDGPAAYFSRLPVGDLAAAIEVAGAPSVVSNSAGTYICNEVTYAMQHHLETAGRDVPSGFVHLPYLPEQVTERPGVPSMALETQVLGVRAAIEFIRDLVAVPAVAGAAE
jgi:pyroglutamyl-peptidase